MSRHLRRAVMGDVWRFVRVLRGIAALGSCAVQAML